MITTVWRLVNIAVALALGVVFLGAWTRINDAGLSCPDWPGCYGHLVMPTDTDKLQSAQQAFPDTPIEMAKTHLEMGHRYLAGILGLIILALAVYAYKLRALQKYPVVLSYILLVLVTVQALFGMWTVTMKLYPPVVTLHLLGGVLTLTLLLFLRAAINQVRLAIAPTYKKPTWLIAAVLVLLMQIVLGGWTSSNYAGVACESWLQCNPDTTIQPDFKTGFDPTVVLGPNYQGGLLPVEARAAIQIGHRFGALVVVLVALVVAIQFFSYQHLRPALYLMAGLLAGQIALGALNVVYAVPAILAMLHHALAVALLLSFLWLYLKIIKSAEVLSYERN